MGDLIKRKVFIPQTYAVCCVPGTEGVRLVRHGPRAPSRAVMKESLRSC